MQACEFPQLQTVLGRFTETAASTKEAREVLLCSSRYVDASDDVIVRS